MSDKAGTQPKLSSSSHHFLLYARDSGLSALLAESCIEESRHLLFTLYLGLAGSNQTQYPARGSDIFTPWIARHSPEGLVKWNQMI